jgi:hypothetical protein
MDDINEDQCNATTNVVKALTKSESLEDLQIVYAKDTTNICNMRKIEIKSDVFEGYFIWVDISKKNNIDHIIDHVKLQLVNFLKTFNLHNLTNYAVKMQFKLNIFTSYQELIEKTRENDTIYLYEQRVPKKKSI